jgi:hypothetical protein
MFHTERRRREKAMRQFQEESGDRHPGTTTQPHRRAMLVRDLPGRVGSGDNRRDDDVLSRPRRLAGRLGLIPAEVAAGAHHSYREFRRLQHQVRLQGERYARVPRQRVEPLIAPVLRLWDEVFGTQKGE